MVPHPSFLLIILVHQLSLLKWHQSFLTFLTIEGNRNSGIHSNSPLTSYSFRDDFLICNSRFKVERSIMENMATR